MGLCFPRLQGRGGPDMWAASPPAVAWAFTCAGLCGGLFLQKWDPFSNSIYSPYHSCLFRFTNSAIIFIDNFLCAIKRCIVVLSH